VFLLDVVYQKLSKSVDFTELLKENTRGIFWDTHYTHVEKRIFWMWRAQFISG